MFACILPVFGLKPALGPALTAMSVTNLGILVPSSPGFVGSFHYFCKQALVAQGVAEATALGFALVVHLTFYIPVTLWGAAAMLWYGVEVGATAAIARAARSSPRTASIRGVPVHVIAPLGPPRSPRPASAFDYALVEALLPAGEESGDQASVEFSTRFVSEEMQALPARLAFLYAAGMSTFRFYVRLRYLRSFCALPLERRRAAVEAWAFGRIGLLRQRFRPVRSTALLAYYEGRGSAASVVGATRKMELVANG
jgi:hypothetical protein